MVSAMDCAMGGAWLMGAIAVLVLLLLILCVVGLLRLGRNG